MATKLITAEQVMPLVIELAKDSYEGRGGGYPGEKRAADYIARQYEALGLQGAGDTSRGRRGFLQSFSFMPHAPIKPWERRRSQNVLAFIEGSDPELKREILVIGAHYDGQGKLGQADAGPRLAPKDASDPIWNSANDNLSSCSAVLAIARAVRQGGIRIRRSILFVAFGAEEHELCGSVHYVTSPAFELSRHVAMIDLECVGRMPDKPLALNASMTGGFWPAAMKSANELMGTNVQPNIPVPIPDSDHYPFASSRIPAVMVIGASDPDRHLPTDTSDKIDPNRIAEAARFAYAMLMDLANRDERPKFSQSMMPDLGLTADLSTSAECDAIGLPPGEGCFRITNIIPNRPGERAGFKQGDAMIAVAGKPVRRDVTLKEAEEMVESILRGKMGPELHVTVLRAGKRIDLTLPITSK